MIQAPQAEYQIKIGAAPGVIGATGTQGQWISWPQTGQQITAFSGTGPSAQPLGVYLPSVNTTGKADTSNSGSIGQVTSIVTDSNGGNWYVVDTTNGSIPAKQQFTNYNSNTIYIPAFGDTSNPDITNLTPSQAAAGAAGTNLLFTNQNGTGGLGILPGPGAALNGVEKTILGLFLAGLATVIIVNQVSK